MESATTRTLETRCAAVQALSRVHGLRLPQGEHTWEAQGLGKSVATLQKQNTMPSLGIRYPSLTRKACKPVANECVSEVGRCALGIEVETPRQ